MDLEQRLDMSLDELVKLNRQQVQGERKQGGRGATDGSGKGDASKQGKKKSRGGKGDGKGPSRHAPLKVQTGGVKKASAGASKSGRGVTVGGVKKVAIRTGKQNIMPSRPLPQGRKKAGGRGGASKATSTHTGRVIELKLGTPQEAQRTLQQIQRAALQAQSVLRKNGLTPKLIDGLAAGTHNIMPSRRGGKQGAQATKIIREIHYVPAPTAGYGAGAHSGGAAAWRAVPASLAAAAPPPDPPRHFHDDRDVHVYEIDDETHPPVHAHTGRPAAAGSASMRHADSRIKQEMSSGAGPQGNQRPRLAGGARNMRY